MSTSYYAKTFYGYSLPRSELSRKIPNLLWGQCKFDPNTGEKVTQFITEKIDLGLEADDNHPKMTRFTRFDVGYEDHDSIILGIELAGMDLSYGSPEPRQIQLLSDAECAKVADTARELLEKAGVPFYSGQMGYWMGGHAG